jgi:hypothetical protein
VNVGFDQLKLRIITTEQHVAPFRMSRCNPHGKPALAEMPNDAAREKSSSAEHGDGAIVHGGCGSRLVSHKDSKRRAHFISTKKRDIVAYLFLGGVKTITGENHRRRINDAAAFRVRHQA